MLAGHFAVGLAAKRVVPRTSLGTLVLAVLLPDLFWCVFQFLQWEHAQLTNDREILMPVNFYDQPFSHSLLAVTSMALAFGLLYWAFRRSSWAALILACAVLSHWILDFIAHRQDLLLWPGTVKLGLGLWNSRPATVVVEFGLWAAGVTIYATATKATSAIGKWGLWALAAVVCAMQYQVCFGAPPSRLSLINWGVASQALLVVWAYVLDRHRAIPALAATST